MIFNAVLSERVKKFGRKVVVGDLVMVGDLSVKEILDESEASACSFDDVVLPLVGTSVLIPSNMKSFYCEEFSKLDDQISLESTFTAPPPGTQKFLILSGAYRKAVSRAKRLSWVIRHNVSDTDVIVQSDVDRLTGKGSQEDEKNSEEKNSQEKIIDAPGALSKAVVFECSLDSGVYLTMAAREVTEVVVE